MVIAISHGQSSAALRLKKYLQAHYCILANYGHFPEVDADHYKLVSVGIPTNNIGSQWLNFCISNNVTHFVPLLVAEMQAMANNHLIFAEFGIQLLLPPHFAQLPVIHSSDEVDELIIKSNDDSMLNPIVPYSLSAQTAPAEPGVYAVANGRYKLYAFNNPIT